MKALNRAIPSDNRKLPEFISKQVSEGRYFFLELSPPRAAELLIVGGGCEACPPSYEMNRGSFHYYGLEYVAAGAGKLTLKGQDYDLQPGSIFAYGPKTPHNIRTNGPEPMVKYFVDFAGRRAQELLAASSPIHRRAHRVVQSRWLYDNFNQLLDCGQGSHANAQRQCTKLFELILMQLEEDAEQPLTGEPSHAFSTFCRCQRYIEERFSGIATNAEIAKACHVDPAYLSRLFQRFARESPYHYLTRLKIGHAAKLLILQDSTVQTVAASVGYDDPYHFSRVFKRIYGLSPRNFVLNIGRSNTAV